MVAVEVTPLSATEKTAALAFLAALDWPDVTALDPGVGGHPVSDDVIAIEGLALALRLHGRDSRGHRAGRVPGAQQDGAAARAPPPPGRSAAQVRFPASYLGPANEAADASAGRRGDGRSPKPRSRAAIARRRSPDFVKGSRKPVASAAASAASSSTVKKGARGQVHRPRVPHQPQQREHRPRGQDRRAASRAAPTGRNASARTAALAALRPDRRSGAVSPSRAAPASSRHLARGRGRDRGASICASSTLDIRLMADPFRLRVLKSLTDTHQERHARQRLRARSERLHRRGRAPASRVFRGRRLFGFNDPLPMISILEAPQSEDQLFGDRRFGPRARATGRSPIQAFVPDDSRATRPTPPIF